MFLTQAEVTLAVGVLTALSVLGGSLLTAQRDERRAQRDREYERERWAREDSQREQERQHAERVRLVELEHEDAARWIDNRLALHDEFLTVAREIMAQYQVFSTSCFFADTDENPPTINGWQINRRLKPVLAKTQLLASDSVVSAAMAVDDVFDTAGTLSGVVMAQWRKIKKPADPQIEQYDDHLKIVKAKVDDYVKAARRELGTVSGRLDRHA